MSDTDADSTGEGSSTPKTARSLASQSPCHFRAPRLGDFSRLARSAISSPVAPPSYINHDDAFVISSPIQRFTSPSLSRLERPSTSSSDKSTSLGDFSKLRDLLRPSLQSSAIADETPETDSREPQETQHTPKAIPTISILKRSDGPVSKKNSKQPPLVPKLLSRQQHPPSATDSLDRLSPLNGNDADANMSSQSERELTSETENSDSDGTGATSLSSSVGQDEKNLKKSSLIVSSRPPVTTRQRRDSLIKRNPSQPATILLTDSRSREKRHESLSVKLARHCLDDNITTNQYPGPHRHGIHVFLDLSNIHISFRRVLQAKFGADANARFAPTPEFNFEFLTEILIRGRFTRILNAGCSVRPDRPQPSFVATLHQIGYHVDVRERKLVSEARPTPTKPASAVAFMPKHGRSRKAGATQQQDDIHYVEDLVDETLQTRIGESVMEYFDCPGTLVLATGDGQPAKYSDGFVTYADRALRMGWNVEIVSWSRGLSSAWRDPEWASRWGSRFRIIELDEFLDDLWTPL